MTWRLTTRQQWCWPWPAIASEATPHGGICTVDDQPVSWTVLTLAVGWLTGFDLVSERPPHLTRRGAAALSRCPARPSTRR